MDFTPDQIEKLNSLGISPLIQGEKIPQQRNQKGFLPLLSISGLTLLSFGGIVLFKSKATQSASPAEAPVTNHSEIRPTQVPKSIQHYLLASQQYFTQALQLQSNSSTSNQSQTIDLLNQSILAATQAIKEFPNDFRGYQQRGRVYQSLIDSKPDLINQTIADLTAAQKLNPNSVEIIHNLASLFAKKGDIQNTLIYLTQTVALEPTKAQNFYDLAKIQQQTGLISQALETYNRLIPLITDATQKTQVESEKTALEQLLAQNVNPSEASAKEGQSPTINPSPAISLPDNPPTIQAMLIPTGLPDEASAKAGLIIAAPETSKKIEVENLADSNSLAGNASLAPNQKEISITNSNLKPESQVYISVLKGGKNQTLKVQSRSNNSFVVGFDTAIPEEVNFKWWIIN